MKNGNGKNRPTFIHYMAMGAGFAAGAALASVAVTLATLGVKELHQMFFSPIPEVLPPYQQTKYVNANPPQGTVSGG